MVCVFVAVFSRVSVVFSLGVRGDSFLGVWVGGF